MSDKVDVKTVYDTLVYHRTQFFKESCNWVWSYPRHEVCLADDCLSAQVLPDACVVPFKEGSRAKDPDRFSRDALVLQEYLIDNPNDPRAIFYLAQSYSDAQEYSKALETIENIFDSNPWDEERWVSLLRKARWSKIYNADDPTFVVYYLEAYNLRPIRAEPLYDLAVYYREKKMWSLALLFAQKGLNLSYPSDDILFVEKDIYDWKLKSEVATASFNLGEEEKAVTLAKEILQQPNLPTGERVRLENNITRYAKVKQEG